MTDEPTTPDAGATSPSDAPDGATPDPSTVPAGANPDEGATALDPTVAPGPEAAARHEDADLPHTPEDKGSEEPVRRKKRDVPLVAVVTGKGKGKSTSSFGMLQRSWARGYRCGVFQFVKGGKWKVGERKAAEALSASGAGGTIEWEIQGKGWTWIQRDMTESEDIAKAGWEEVKRRIAAERYEFLLLDEITYPIAWGWIDVEDVIATLAARPGFQHVVLTGRNAHERLVETADLVSEVVNVKHPMQAGIRAQQGIDW
jgi:cob(I)alamin adenosyltransferase